MRRKPFQRLDSCTSRPSPSPIRISRTVASSVYFRVNTTESANSRWVTALVKLAGKFQPWLPDSRGHLEADICSTSSSGSTNSPITNRAFGRA